MSVEFLLMSGRNLRWSAEPACTCQAVLLVGLLRVWLNVCVCSYALDVAMGL